MLSAAVDFCEQKFGSFSYTLVDIVIYSSTTGNVNFRFEKFSEALRTLISSYSEGPLIRPCPLIEILVFFNSLRFFLMKGSHFLELKRHFEVN